MRAAFALASTLAITTLASSCVFHVKGHRSDCVTVDGVTLEEKHDETLEFGAWDPAGLTIEAAIGDLRIEPTDGPSRVVSTVFEQEVGDATLVYEDGVLRADSRSGGPSAIGDTTLYLNGPLPAIHATTGLGDLEVFGLQVDGVAVLNTGMGDVNVTNSGAGTRLAVSSGLGDVILKSIQTQAFRADSGMGDVIIEEAHASDGHISSGLGDVVVRGSSFDKLDAVTGLGDVVCKGTTYATGEISSGLGDVVR